MATFFAMDDFSNEDFAISFGVNYLLKSTKIRQIGMNYNLFAIIYNDFKVFLKKIKNTATKPLKQQKGQIKIFC